MSLGIVIKGPEGLVLAADSRVTLSAQTPGGPLHVNYDNATKLLSFNQSYVGAVTYGQAAMRLRSANSFLPEFEAALPEDERLSVDAFANRLSEFFVEQWDREMPDDYDGPNMTFVVGGYNIGEPYGRVYLFEIPRQPEPRLQHNDGFGMTWGGQRDFVDRLIQGFDGKLMSIVSNSLNLENGPAQELYQRLKAELQMPIPIQAMALQDCVDLAVFFIKTTVLGQRLTVGIRGVGGPIDVAVITRRKGFKFIKRKEITSEAES